jgi:nitrite reductase (NADH) small subunit
VTSRRERRRVTIPAEDLPVGTWRVIVCRGREIVVVNADGSPRAMFNRCPHQHAPLAGGRLAGAPRAGPVGELNYEPGRHVLRCPWHRYEFDLETGACLAEPKRLRVATYEVCREGDEYAVYV